MNNLTNKRVYEIVTVFDDNGYRLFHEIAQNETSAQNMIHHLVKGLSQNQLTISQSCSCVDNNGVLIIKLVDCQGKIKYSILYSRKVEVDKDLIAVFNNLLLTSNK